MIEEIKANVEYWFIKYNPLLCLPFYRKRQEKWERLNISDDYKKLIRHRRRKLKRMEKRIKSESNN